MTWNSYLFKLRAERI